MPPKTRPASPTALHPALSEAVRALACRGVEKTFRKGTLIIQEGDVGDTIYIIVAGRLRVFGSNAGSEREITYGTYGPGEYVGEMGLDGGPRAASVIALEASTCVIIQRATLEQHLAENPAFAFELIAKLIRRARAATFSAKQLALNDVYGRLKLLLESLAVPQGDGTWRFTEQLKQREMADRIGCTREMVSRVLKDLETAGCIDTARGTARLLKRLPVRY